MTRVVLILMGVSSLVFYYLAYKAPVSKRVVHSLTALATTISFLTYLALATGDGTVYSHRIVRDHHKHVPATTTEIYHLVYWVRYVNWILTTPLLLVNLGLLGGVNGAGLFVAISADIIMFVSGLVASFATHRHKWVWFAISVIAYLTVVYQIGYRGGRAVASKDRQVQKFFGTISAFALTSLLLYPIFLAACPLARAVSVDAEVVGYGILDILLQGILGAWLLVGFNRLGSVNVEVDGFWSHGVGNEGAIRIAEEEGA